jgi:predicted RNA-binding protein associated with RNAse of E/G family
VLSFAWPKTPYSVLLWSTPDEGRVWYVNIESPLERTAIGFDTTDHALDVLVALDGSTVVWKDERELEEAVRGGLFSEQEADSFRRWGARAADRIRRREPPFDADWTGWRPDPSWGRPRLPHGWADA